MTQVRNPDFQTVVTDSFAQQGLMAHLGATTGKQTHCATMTATMIRVDLTA